MVTKAKSKAVATTGDDIPDYLKKIVVEGNATLNDNFDTSDVQIPQIKLLQGLSPQISNFDTAKAGHFWHTGLDLDLGTEVPFVVCSRRKRYLLQAPLDDTQGILARSDDAKTWDRLGKWEVILDKKRKVSAVWEIKDLNVEESGLTQWGSSDPEDSESPPAATLFYDYLVILPSHMEVGPAVISLARSAIKRAKRGLNDKISLHSSNGRPLQSIKFAGVSSPDRNDIGQEFFNWQFTGAGFADEELYNSAVAISEALKEYGVQEEGQQDAPAKADSDEY